MPHDFADGHSHHHHDHPHHEDHSHTHVGHNGGGEHFHSHMHEDGEEQEVAALAAEFVSSFRDAEDKAAFLTLSGIPRERPSETGGPTLKLVDARETIEWQVGTASPAFGTRELSYLPYSGDLIKERSRFDLTYVSITERRDIRIEEIIAERLKKG